MGVCRPTSSASWLCFIVFLNLMFQIHIAKANSSITAASSTTTTTTTPPPTTTTTEKVTSKAATTTTSQGTTVTSSSSVKTTAPSVPTTTTAPPGPTTTEAPALGVDCSNKGDDWCNSTISGAVECRDDRCQCRTGHFQSNSTSCTSLMDLIPQNISTSDVTTTSFNVLWVHEDSVKDLVLDHTVTARLVYTDSIVQDVPCNVTSSLTAFCSKLLQGFKYDVNITASFDSSEPRNSIINESTEPDIPGELNDASSDFNALNVTLVWSGSKGRVDFYAVKVTQSDDAGAVWNITTSDDSPRINIGSLETGKTYKVSIIANSYGKSSLESRDTFTVSDVPGPPTNVTVASVTANSIKITWTKTEKPNGVIQSHQVCVEYKFYIEDSYANQVCQNVSADITEYEKSSLTAGTFYQFDVYTVNNGFKSNNASVYQRTVESVPTMVSGLEAESHDTSLNVTWSRPLQPNGDIITYRVHWRNKTGHENCTVFLTSPESNNMTNSCENITEPENISVNQENLNYMIINLIPYTTYTIEVTAYTTEGPGEVDTIDKMTSVAAPDPVTNVNATVLNDTAVNVTWKIPTVNPGPVNYTVTTNNMVDNTISSQSCEVEENTGKHSYGWSGCVVSGLEEYWLYNFNVTASTDEGTSNPSVSQNITTNESEPGAVSSFSYKLYNVTSDCDATKATVIWKEPGLHDRNSLITRYTLQSEQSYDKYHAVTDQDPYRLDNRQFEKDLTGLKADSKYTWKISAFSFGRKEGPISSLSFTTGVCAPPVWNNADLQKVKEKSSTTTSLTIMLSSSFFDKSQQGRIEEKGLIILPRESDYFDSDTSNIEVETLLHWQNAKDHQFIKDYKIMITDSVAGEFTIGEETRCVKPDFCNGPLPEQFSFKVAAYACTRRSGLLLCTVSPPLGPFATEAPPEPPGSSQSAVIIVLSVLLVLSACAAAFVILWYKEIINPITWCPKKGGGGSNGDDDDDFTALDRIDRTRPIKIWEYATVLEEMHKDTNLILSDQYDDINRIGQLVLESSSTEASRLESNTPKNRWVNILPFDHSRVKLQQIDDDDPTSDYINANYMPGFNNKREYIATQGPLPGTIDDFWRMVWEHGVMVIVMLTQCKEGNRVKCEKYWPDELREPKQYGDVVVNPISISTLDKYNISIFDVSVNGQSRQVIHFHYLDFPDFSANVEFDHFITFVRTVRNHVPRDNTGPIIVHCSAGVGRTGTFIATDRLNLYLNSPDFDEDDDVDIFGIVVSMRENRIAMVQTESQYIMIHDCFENMLDEKKKAMQATDSVENLYENQGFDPYPEVLYENVTSSEKQPHLQEQQQTEL